ncbi:2995_t:CDS:1, partial [Funneliformis geosporum]
TLEIFANIPNSAYGRRSVEKGKSKFWSKFILLDHLADLNH